MVSDSRRDLGFITSSGKSSSVLVAEHSASEAVSVDDCFFCPVSVGFVVALSSGWE